MPYRSHGTILLLAVVVGGWIASRSESEELPAKSNASEKQLAKLNEEVANVALQLAENELKVLVDANQRLPNTFPRAAVNRAKQAVSVAKQRTELEGKYNPADIRSSYLAHTQADLKAAEADYVSAVAANKQFSKAVPTLEIEHLKLVTQLAKLRMERAQLAKDVSETVLVMWQLDDIREQIRRLHQQVDLYRGNE